MCWVRTKQRTRGSNVDSLTIRLTHLILNASTRMHILASEPSQCLVSVLQLQPALLVQSPLWPSPAKHLLCFSEHYILVTKRQPCCKTGAVGLRGCCVTNGSGAFLFFFFLAALCVFSSSSSATRACEQQAPTLYNIYRAL